MALLGIDLGGTKLAVAIFSDDGVLLSHDKYMLDDREGEEVGSLITGKVRECLQRNESEGSRISSIGISIPGIYRSSKGTVWAPNIPGWTDYPLLDRVKAVSGSIPVTIDSDRACYILGEQWQGNARGCKDAIFLAVGTGIGAGIIANGSVLRGAHDIAGAIGWMALKQPFADGYSECGCFEHHASGEGLVKMALQYLEEADHHSPLRSKGNKLSAQDIFHAFEGNDPVATRVIGEGIRFWGMAVANLVSLFNPEKIILGGGVFGPAIAFLPSIREEALKWAQPVSVQQYTLTGSALGGEAGVYGAGFLALKNISSAVEHKD